jgi:hypothetical protein
MQTANYNFDFHITLTKLVDQREIVWLETIRKKQLCI